MATNVSNMAKQQKDKKKVVILHRDFVFIPDIQSMFRLILSCVQGPGSIKTRMGAQAANAAAKASTKTLS